MTNPNNAIGTNGAYGGRTSVNAFNDNLAIFQGRGVLSGFVVSPNAGMSVAIGGDGSTRDVAIAEDNIGNKTTINNISESPISLTIAGAPASNSRIDAIVAYVDNPAQGSATETDNPSACGLLDVQGAVSATPSQPDENAIRTAITADGASGSTAYYVVLGYITVANGTTDITSEMINQSSVQTKLASKIVAWEDGIKTVVDVSGRIGTYFPDGTLITKRRVIKQNTPVNIQWGSLYRHAVPDYFTLAPVGAQDFIETPIAQVSLTASGTSSIMQASWADMTPTTNNANNRYAIPYESVAVVRPTSATISELYIDIVAVGRWK